MRQDDYMTDIIIAAVKEHDPTIFPDLSFENGEARLLLTLSNHDNFVILIKKV